MRFSTIITERYQDYKIPSMYIGCISCNGKCCIEAGIPISICINDGWRGKEPHYIDDDELIEKYLSNPITEAIIFAGLEPFEQFDEIYSFIKKLRKDYRCSDTVVIYTGYYKNEIEKEIEKLREFENIIIKFGRYIPNDESRFDELLGVTLASKNQYAEKIS